MERDGWSGIVQPNRSFKPKNPEWIGNGSGALWSYQKSGEVLEPGAVTTGSRLRAICGPDSRSGSSVSRNPSGLVVPARVATSGYVPDIVKEQMDRLLGLEYNSKMVLMIGPKC